MVRVFHSRERENSFTVLYDTKFPAYAKYFPVCLLNKLLKYARTVRNRFLDGIDFISSVILLKFVAGVPSFLNKFEYYICDTYSLIIYLQMLKHVLIEIKLMVLS